MTFKVGDRVRRVSDLGGPFKDKDTVWEVSQISRESIRVAGNVSWWLADKFMLAEETPSLPGIPAGYRAVRFGKPKRGELFLNCFRVVQVSDYDDVDWVLIVESVKVTTQPAYTEPDVNDAPEIDHSSHPINNDEWLRFYCNRYKNGQCQSSACLNRGGFTGGQPDYDLATCEAHEILTELDMLRAIQTPIAEAPKARIDPGEGWRILDDDEIAVKTDERKYWDSSSCDWLWLSEVSSAMAGQTVRQLRKNWNRIIIRRRIEVPEPQPPAESPDDWVEITDREHVLRDDDELNANLGIVTRDGIANSDGWVSIKKLGIAGKKFCAYPSMQLRCRNLPIETVRFFK